MIVLCIVLALIVIAVVAVLLLDAVPIAFRWYERIGIGLLTKEEATENIKNVTCKWLIKTPSVPLKDETRLTVIDRVKGEYTNGKLQSWQKAALLLGANEAKCIDTVKSFIESELGIDGKFKNFVKSPDFALLAYAVLLSREDKQSLKSAMDEVYFFLKESAGEGTVPYNNAVKNIRFVDTLGMVCPFLYLYAKTYDCEEAKTLAMKQLLEYKENAFSEKVNLPMHCFNVKTGAPLGVCGWGRGCGWYALALSGMLKVSVDEEILGLAEEFMTTLIPYALENGGFSRQILAEASGESSATAMIGHLSAVLYKITAKEKYKTCADGAVKFICASTRKNGKVDYAQGDTKGIGFYSLKLDIMPAAQGFSLLLLSEVSQ